MTDAAAISGDFCTFRHVQGRKVLQIVIEVPAEAAGAVFAKLGMPGSGEGIPVAVARLHSPAEPIAKPEAPKERRPFRELPYSTQAAMRCQEIDFSNFMTATGRRLTHTLGKPDAEEVADCVRELCGVVSRKELDTQPTAGARWREIEAEYWAWQRGAR